MRVRGSLFGLRDSNSVFDLTSHEREGLLYVFAVFGGCLEESHIEVFSELLALFEGDRALIFEVTLVADQDA